MIGVESLSSFFDDDLDASELLPYFTLGGQTLCCGNCGAGFVRSICSALR